MQIVKLKKILILALLGLLTVFLSKINVSKFMFNSRPVIAAMEISLPASGDQVNVQDFGAVGDGIADDTLAIQKAIDAVVRNFDDKNTRDFRTVYFPPGTYLVSNTIELGRTKIIQGARQDKTIIRLQDRSPQYNETPKAVLRSIYNNNQTFGIYLKDLTVDIGQKNPQAIGIQYNTHNSGAIENVTISSQDSGSIGLDMSETEFGPGMVKNLTVIGFDTGIKTPAAPSNAVFSHIILKQQNIVGLENNMPISIEGLKSENRVPVIRNSSHSLAHLVLIDGEFNGLSNKLSPNLAAIETEGAYYLRQIKAKGSYISALRDRGELIPQKEIEEKWSDLSSEIVSHNDGHLKLPVKQPPLSYLEPIADWAIPEATQDDDTKAIQAAMNSGAKTIFFPGNRNYKISNTIEVPSSVRRIVAQQSGIEGTEIFVNQPMLKIAGNTSKPITIEGVSLGAWPYSITAFEVACDRPVYFKYSNFIAAKNSIVTASDWSGEIFLDEYLGTLQLSGNGSAWIRQWNPENNPFEPATSDSQLTYAVNDGAKLWILGMKTEAPAIHIVTKNKGQTELLGGFFRDHFSPSEYQPEVPYLITEDASVSASYLQYANAPGKARKLQAVEIQNSQSQKIETPPELLTVELYQSKI